MILTADEIKQVRHFMIDADMTMKGLADACGIKYATLAYILRQDYLGPACERVMKFVQQETK